MSGRACYDSTRGFESRERYTTSYIRGGLREGEKRKINGFSDVITCALVSREILSVFKEGQ